MTTIPTKEKLAQALHGVGLFDLEKRARAGEFSDFEGESATPKVDLIKLLAASALVWPGNASVIEKLSLRIRDGEYDDTPAEADAWYEREGKFMPCHLCNPPCTTDCALPACKCDCPCHLWNRKENA